MKRFLFFISALAALSLSGSCSREVAGVSQEGDFINATFKVSLPGDMATKAISDGTLADELTFIAFDENGRQIAGLDQTVAITNKEATVTAKLIRGVQYTFAFWAQKAGQYAVSYMGTDTEHPFIVITTEQLPKMMNSDDYDAFFGTLSLKKDADFEEPVTLTRPFAQINLAVDTEDYNTAVANGIDMATATSSFSFERQDGLKNRLQLFDGAVAKTEDFTGTITGNAAAIPGDYISSGNERYARLAMLYVLAPADPNETATLDLSVAVNAVQNGDIPVTITRDIANVPVKKNYRTNIIGKLFSIGGTFTVTLSEGFAEPDNTVNMDTPAQPKYTVSIDPKIVNGTVTFPNNSTADTEFEEGQTVTLVATPEDNYEVEKVYYIEEGGQTEQTINKDDVSGKYLFFMPAKNVTVSATFTAKVTPFSYTGDGTLANPYTVADVRHYIDNDLVAGTKVYVKGIVSDVDTQYGSNTYGNATFNIVDNAGDTDFFQAYRASYFFGKAYPEEALGLPTVSANDNVVVYGEPTLYNSSVYELKQGGELVSLNDKEQAETPLITGVLAGVASTVIPADGSLTIAITTLGTPTIYYTTDGSTPTENSMLYTNDFQITDACTIKAICVDPTKYTSYVASQEFTKASGTQTSSITYNFGEHTDFATWTASYTAHTLSYTEADVIFASADKNSQTITDIPVTKGGNVSLVMTNGAKLEEVSFNCRQWGNKAQTITLHYSTDGGASYSSTNITSTTFSIADSALPSGTNAVQITFSSTSNQVGIESVTFKLAE